MILSKVRVHDQPMAGYLGVMVVVVVVTGGEGTSVVVISPACSVTKKKSLCIGLSQLRMSL